MKSIVLLGVLSASLFASQNPEALFDTKCSTCHMKSVPMDKSTMIAPPLNGVMRHVKMAYPSKKEAIAFVVDYVQNPSKKKAVCMKQKIARFGLMPSQKGNVTPHEIEVIASWMYDNYPKTGFKGQGMLKRYSQKNKKQMNKRRISFEMIDTNKDGMISKDEFQAFQKMRQEKMMQMKQQNKTACQYKMLHQ